MATTSTQDQKFRSEMQSMISEDILDTVIGWINRNLEPDQVFDDEDLEKWAEANGYEKKE